MNQRPNPTAIGVFVMAGVLLIVAALAFFGTTNFLSPKERFILYFDDSVAGLEVGAAVKFKGVRIGQVSEVLIHFDPEQNKVRMPVIIEIDSRLLQSSVEKTLTLKPGDERSDQLLSRLRGRLEMASFVTGLLYVGLDYYPHAPPFEGSVEDPPYREIGTEPSSLAEFKKRLQEIDFVGISERLASILESVDVKLKQLDVETINDRLTGSLASLDTLLQSREIHDGIQDLSRTIKELRNLAVNLDSRVEPFALGLQDMQGEVSATLTELQLAVQEVRNLVRPNAPVLVGLQTSLSELSKTLKTVRELAEYLNRNPRALISGKPAPER